MKTKRTRWWLKSAALLCATVFGLTAFGYDDGGRYVAETETFSESTSITGDIWIGNNNTGVFTESQAFVWASADGTLNAGATLTGWLRIADWGGTEEKPLYGNLEIQSGSYSAGGFTVGGTTAAYTYSWATLSGGLLTVPSVSIGSTSENAGTATLTLNGGTLATTSVTGTGTLAIGANGGTFANTDSATISTALTGSGTLTKTGAGELAITGDVSGFKGKIVVDKDAAGYVTIGSETIYPGQTKDFDPQATYTVWSEDFEGATALQGWTYEGTGYGAEIRTRTLADGTSSKYYCYTAQKSGGNSARSVTAAYALNLADADIYAFEFDVYPKAAWNNDNTLTVTGVKSVPPEVEGGEESVTPVTLATFVAKYPGSANPGTFQITAGNVTGSVSMDGRGADNTTADTSARWYRVVISGDKAADKTYLQVLNRDGTVAVERSEIGEFAKVSELSVNLKTSGNGPTMFGFDNFVFKTVAPAGIPADPVVEVTPDSYAGDRTVTITCEDENAKIYYCDSDSGEYVEYTAGTGITVSATTTISAYAKNSIGKSDTVSLVVYANVKLNAPTVVRRGWYRLQITAGDAPIAGEEPQYVFSYVMNGCGTTPKTTETGDSALVRASSGAGFNVNGTWARVFAKADGYKDSDTVNYAGYTFDPTKFNELYNMDWIDESINQPRSSVWPDDTMIAVDGVNYRSFGTGAKSYANDYFFVSADNDSGGSSRWDIYRSNKSSNGLRYNGATTVGNGRVLFKDVKPGTLIYLNSDELTDPVNMTLVSEGYTNADEYVYEVTGEGETVNATIKIGVNYGHIYCVKIYEPIPEETDTFAADEATLVDGAFTVPEGTTKITLGGKDVTRGFNIKGTTATLLSPWFAWNGAAFGEGMVIDEETVRLDIDLVEGLYYGPAAATTLEGLARPATLTMYDGTNAAALTTVAKPEGGTAFFTVYVDVKAE